MLGGKCVDCGERRQRFLEFDIVHPYEAISGHGQMEWSARISLYRREHRLNNLTLRCRRCNAKKSDNFVLSFLPEPPKSPAANATNQVTHSPADHPSLFDI